MDSIKPKVPFITLIAAVAGFAIMILGAILEKAPVAGFINLPAFLIVFGGTFGATCAACGLEKFMKVIPAYMTAQKAALPDWEKTATELVRVADVARREGLLKLEEEAKQASDPFLQSCFQLLADGTDPGVMREILWAQIETEHGRFKEYGDIFTKMGGFAPTMGIIGTVMGLTHALQLLDDPSALGPAIASAFMATFYGVASANLVWVPTGDRITAYGKIIKEYRGMIVAATMSIQRGDNPRQVAEKLAAMAPEGLDPATLTGKGKKD